MNQDDKIILNISECLKCGNIIKAIVSDLMTEQEQIEEAKEIFKYDLLVSRLTVEEYNKLEKEFCNCIK